MSTAGAYTFDAEGIFELSARFGSLDLTGKGPPPVPWGSEPSLAAFEKALESGEHFLPLGYRRTFVEPLRASLPRLLKLTEAAGSEPAETFLSAVYQHAPKSEVAEPLRRFLHVVSELYRSFLSAEKRMSNGIHPIASLPPLAAYRSDGSLGPYTFPSDIARQTIGSLVGVVSLPSAYREHPLLWGALAHEVGGHDILHADPALIPELRSEVSRLCSRLERGNPLIGMVWSHWIDETASDVCGVLNLGPSFALSVLPWLAAIRMRELDASRPTLLGSSISGAEQPLDVHPTDILRVDVAIGAIAALRGLAPATRAAYIGILQRFARLMAGDASAVTLQGQIPGETRRSPGSRLNVEIPLALMRARAQAVGHHIAAVRLRCLGNASLQDFETWGDLDESVARWTSAGLVTPKPSAHSTHVTHALAGATIAAVAIPEAYSRVTEGLDELLSDTVDRVQAWRSVRPRPAIAGTPKF